MAQNSFSDQLWNGLADAVSDIRQKVVEEPMWGRAVTDGPEGPRWPEARDEEPSFGSSTHVREMEHEPGLDR
jgi:hypothetical protein